MPLSIDGAGKSIRDLLGHFCAVYNTPRVSIGQENFHRMIPNKEKMINDYLLWVCLTMEHIGPWIRLEKHGSLDQENYTAYIDQITITTPNPKCRLYW